MLHSAVSYGAAVAPPVMPVPVAAKAKGAMDGNGPTTQRMAKTLWSDPRCTPGETPWHTQQTCQAGAVSA
jgi:hypothetical protein